MDHSDTWAGAPVLVPPPAPSLEVGIPSTWHNGRSSCRVIGEIDLAATPAAVRLARSYVRELVGQHFGADRSELGDLELLTSEAMTASVLHARPRRDGTVTLSVQHVDRYVRIEVADGGTGDWAGDTPPLQGHGLALVQALATDFGVQRGKNGTSVFWFGVGVREGWRLP